MVNNKAYETYAVGYGGAIFSWGSTLLLTGSEDVSKPTIFENNFADNISGAFLTIRDYVDYAIKTERGYFAFRSNIAVSSLLLKTTSFKISLV
jgi:hypothetical protein